MPSRPLVRFATLLGALAACESSPRPSASGTGGAPGETGGAGGVKPGGSGGRAGTGGTLNDPPGGGAMGSTGGAMGSTGGAKGTDAGRPPDATGGMGGAPGITSGPPVLMRGYDLKRTGANTRESILSPATVTADSFGKLSCTEVDGEIYAQILYLPAFDFGPKGKHNAIVVATMRNRIYVLDADQPDTVLWSKSYGAPIGGVDRLAQEQGLATCAPYLDISKWLGILSTPAIDPVTGTIYFLARTSEGGNHVQKLYAQSLVDGSDRPGSPVTITASYAGAGDQLSGLKDPVVGGRFSFNPKRQNQRAALTLHGGIVYIAWASFCDFGPYHGWVMGYDAATLQQKIVFNTTPNGRSGGIWMAGSGFAVDDDGSMYFSLGNGTADLAGGSNYTEALIKVRPQGGTLQVSDWFTPKNYCFLEAEDRDFGSSGVMLVPGTNLILAGGKDGKMYVLDKNNLGKYGGPIRCPAMSLPEQPGTDQVLQTLNIAPESQPALGHNHSTPLYWKSAAGEFVYFWAEEDRLRQYKVENGRLTLFKTGTVRAPDEGPGGNGTPRYTMPGGTLALSANGGTGGIVWVTIPTSESANNKVVAGTMYAFDASDVSKQLWNSQMNDRDDFTNYAKFNPVTVSNGKVYVPTFKSADGQNQFCVYGKL
jgi:hypothetical protein